MVILSGTLNTETEPLFCKGGSSFLHAICIKSLDKTNFYLLLKVLGANPCEKLIVLDPYLYVFVLSPLTVVD